MDDNSSEVQLHALSMALEMWKNCLAQVTIFNLKVKHLSPPTLNSNVLIVTLVAANIDCDLYDVMA